MDEQTTNMQGTGAAEQTAAAEATKQPETASENEKNAFQRFMEMFFKGGRDTETVGSGEKKDMAAEGGVQEEKHFTQADMDAAIEAARQKWEEEAAEAERLKKLSPEERAMEEQQRKDTEIADLRSRLLKKELQENAVKALEKDGFPVSLAGVLDYSSKEKMEESLANTMKIFRDSLSGAIQSRLKGRTPEGLGGAASAQNLLKDQIAKNIRGL